MRTPSHHDVAHDSVTHVDTAPVSGAPGLTGAATAEDAVRDYLRFLDDPASLVDTARVAELEACLAAETDPVTRLKLFSAAERAARVDESALRTAFVARAGEFARAEDVPAVAFLRLGVPRQDLVDAGLLPGSTHRPRTGRPGAPVKRTRVGRESIVASLRGLGDGFTVRDVEAASGANQLTVRKALDALLTDGSLVELPPDPGHTGRGRAPRRYRVA